MQTTSLGAGRPAAALPASRCHTVQHWSRVGRHNCGTCGFVLPRAFPLLRSERAKQSCKPLSIAQHEEAGAVISRHLLPSSGCMENSSWTPSWASRQVAGTQPCSSDVLTNHQPGNKAAGGSAKDTHQPKNTSLPTSPESGVFVPSVLPYRRLRLPRKRAHTAARENRS